MKLEGVIHCEADCENHAHVGPDTMAADRLPVGWLRVTEFGGSTDPQEAFCGWECLLKHAATYEPPTIIPWRQALGDEGEGEVNE